LAQDYFAKYRKPGRLAIGSWQKSKANLETAHGTPGQAEDAK